MKITVYHNTSQDQQGRLLGRLDGYEPKHQLTKVAELDVRDTDWQAACDYAYWMFNIGHEVDPPAPDAVAYRARDNRSLDVGDAIHYGGHWYACMSAGWGEITAPRPTKLVDKVLHGTTPAGLAIKRCTADAYLRGDVQKCNAVLDAEGVCYNADRHIEADCCPGAAEEETR